MSKVSSYATLNVIGLLIPIVAFGIVGFLAYVDIINLIDDENWVKHTYTIIDKTEHLLTTLVDAETGQRGYLITGQENFLEPYNSAIPNIADQIKELKQLTADNPVQQSNFDKLDPLITKRLNQLQQNIDLRGNKELSSDIINNIKEGEGKRTMDEIRQVISDIKNEEQQLLTKRSESSQSAAQTTEYIIIFGTVAAITISVLSAYVVNKKLMERRKLDKDNLELRIKTEKLREADIAKEEFSAMITHELKTPLVPILGYCKMLKKSMLGKMSEEQTNAIEVIEKNTKALEELITDIMDIRKLDIGKMKFRFEDLSLDEFFGNLDSSYKKVVGDMGIEFVTKLPVKDIVVYTDKTRLRQVFDNLISNSIKFVSKNNGLIEVGGHKEKDSLILYVKDNGIGIPKEKQSNLFKRFYQIDTSLKRPVSGTGLGLAMSKGIIENLRGEIWVESDGKTGTTFFLKLRL